MAGHETLDCADCHVPSAKAGAIDPDALERGQYLGASGSVSGFTVYESRTLDAEVDQPNGTTRLCLGCHDGTYIAAGGAGHSGITFGSADLATSHPVSFQYDSALVANDGHLLDPASSPAGIAGGGTVAEKLLDTQGRMQCSTCHDPHGDGGNRGLLRWDWDGRPETSTRICRTCHVR